MIFNRTRLILKPRLFPHLLDPTKRTMRADLLLCSLLFLVCSCHANSKKKSISYSNLPWPGFPFSPVPAGYFTGAGQDDYYEDYDMNENEEEKITDNSVVTPAKPDYRPSSAFRSGLASAMHDFGFDLYFTMAKNWTEKQNTLISPLSVYTALSMLTLGLGGNSRAQALKVLHGDAFSDLHEEMDELSSVVFRQNKEVTVTKANRMFVDKSIRLLKDFKRSMKMDYGVTAKKVNFRTSPELNRRRINAYVERNTGSKVKNLAPVGSVTSDTRLFIVNAMYMKASWKNTFYRTVSGKFNTSPTQSIKIDLMQTGSGECFYDLFNPLNANIMRIEMKGSISLIIISPVVAGDFSNIENENGRVLLRQALETLYDPDYRRWPRMCQVTMPKFKIVHEAKDLIDCLKAMGITDIFDSSADLSKMTPPGEPLYVSDMRHKATIDVNEKGLEAAAATSIGVSARMLPQPVLIDRPFMFIVRDDNTGAALFTGKVVQPQYK